MSAVEVATVVVAVLLAAVVQNTAGFGFALLGVPLMSVTVDTHTAVVVATVLGLGSSVVQSWIGREHTDRATARRMTLAAVAGMPAGLLVFAVVGEQTLRLILGISVLALVVLLARGLDLSERGHHVDVAAGVVSGVLATSLSTNGPPLVFALQARQVPAEVFRPTINTVFAFSGILSLAGFALAGEVSGDVVVGVAVALPPLAVGILLGGVARRHVHGARFRAAVLGLLSVAGATAVLSAVRG